MLDRKYIREHLDDVQKGGESRGLPFDAKKFLALDAQERALKQQLENTANRKNEASKKIPTLAEKERKALLRSMKTLTAQSDSTAVAHGETLTALEALIEDIPNVPLADVPVGKSEKENVQVGTPFGKKPKFSFPPQDYLALAERLGAIDVQRAGKVSGTRFGYVLGKLAQLEFALIQYAQKILLPQGFRLVLPPVMIKEENMRAMGYLAGGGESEVYHLPEEKLCLVGTSEQSIGPMHRDELFSEEQLPLRYLAFSTCFRREAGSYGKDTKGILRVHQFDKLEMFSFTTPEQSETEHQFLLARTEELMRGLDLHYRVVQLCTGDLSYASAKTYDIETWMPGQNTFRETSSTSTTTTYQSLPLNIRVQRASGKRELVHMLNGTAFALGRTLIAIIEQYQQRDGTVRVPEALQPYAGFSVIDGA